MDDLSLTALLNKTREDAQAEAAARIAALEAEVARLRKSSRTADLNAEALAEIKATLDGNSTQTVQEIMDGLVAELTELVKP